MSLGLLPVLASLAELPACIATLDGGG